jgi:hypothetical protein
VKNFVIDFFTVKIIFIFVENQIKMLEDNRNLLGAEEYRLHVYENISKIIVNHNYLEENFEFFEKIIFKMWENYYTSILEPISIRKQILMLELFLATMIEMKPTQQLPEDSL